MCENDGGDEEEEHGGKMEEAKKTKKKKIREEKKNWNVVSKSLGERVFKDFQLCQKPLRNKEIIFHYIC